MPHRVFDADVQKDVGPPRRHPRSPSQTAALRSASSAAVRGAAGVLGAAVLLFAGCDSWRSLVPGTPPAPRVPARDAISGPLPCDTACVLFADARPLRAASQAYAPKDSAPTIVAVAGLRFAGAAGDSVQLQLAADSAVLAAAGPSGAVIVATPNGAQAVPLAALARGTTVYRFSGPDTVRLWYGLARTVAQPPAGAAVLTARVSGRIRVVEAQRPWLPLASIGVGSLSYARAGRDITVGTPTGPRATPVR